ncbi:hypothetical protein J3R83DRAFT_4903 [Lanmaoa asiatica]|nr:hypothetical protein J3R83DRAFT_4903 [Lanmaoa asiatica]
MKIEILVDPARPATAQSLVSRVAPPPAAVATTTTTRVARPASRGIRRARGRARKGTERPQKSAADLDAEMEDYTASNTTVPAVAPAVA